MSGNDEYDSSSETNFRPIESTIMKSQWDNINSDDLSKSRKHMKDWVDESEIQDETSIENSIHSRTKYDETEHLNKVQEYVSSVSRRDKSRMDHEIKATSPNKVPTDKMGAYLYGCSSKEVLNSDVDRGCMLSCLQGYRPEDVDACNHDVYVLEEHVLRKIYSSPIKTKSETSYIYTVILDHNLVKERLSKIDELPSSYKVYCTNSIGSSARFMYEVNLLLRTHTDETSKDIIISNDQQSSCPPSPPPNTNSTMFWTWVLIIIVGIIAVLGIIWLVMYFMRQNRGPTVILTEYNMAPNTDMWISSSPMSSSRGSYSY